VGFNKGMETRLTAAQRKALETLKALVPVPAGQPVKTGVHTTVLYSLGKMGLITGSRAGGGVMVNLAITAPEDVADAQVKFKA